MDNQPGIRAQIITRRTYCRPLDGAGTSFETWAQVVDRVIGHQRWLWERALGDTLCAEQSAELDELRGLYLSRRSLPAGRTLWLGGTEIVRRREASSFNCSFVEVRTVHDLVDAFWLLLQGCGVGFRPVSGVLSGFTRRMEVEVVRSTRVGVGGRETNRESYDPATRTWTVSVGDSAEAWAKTIGKLAAGKFPARRLVIDLSELRPAGTRLKGYGWACNGDGPLATALIAIAAIMNRKAGKLLAKSDVWDVINWLGTVLSNRRSAQIGLIDHGDPEWRDVASRKPPGFDSGPGWFRGQSNNSLVFHERPGRAQIRDVFELMAANGGSEPGLINAAEARRRAPWFKGVNPCGEILLADKGFCNLVETDLAAFRDDDQALHRAVWLNARANYRQTVVNLRDGLLQDAWHQANEYLRLCGVGLTGIARRPDLKPHDYRRLRYAASAGAYSMADELGLERPKNVTTVKPSGTLSKVMGTTEGVHKPLGRYVLNTVQFGRHDSLVGRLADAGYTVSDHPADPTAALVTFPVEWPDVEFGAGAVNREPALAQLEQYRRMMADWSDQNVSCTVSYDPSELPGMVQWFDRNWDQYVGVSFLIRNDPTRTPADLGYAYLPQRVVSREEFLEHSAGLRPVDVDGDDRFSEVDAGEECAAGACPVK